MRRLALALCLTLFAACPASAEGARLDWPLRPPPTVARGFDAPSPDWHPGHRGVDLSGSPGQPVYAAGGATVVFAGLLAGRPVVSLAHPGGLRTSYEPVQAAVRVGQPVTSQTMIGQLMAGHTGCPTGRVCTGALCGVRRRAPTMSIRWACSNPLRSGSSRCTTDPASSRRIAYGSRKSCDSATARAKAQGAKR